METKAKVLTSMINEAPLEDALKDKFTGFLAELSSSNLLLHSILDNALEMITAFDSNKSILFWNKAVEKDLGIPLKDVAGKTIYEIFPATIANGFDMYLNRVLQGETIYIEKRPFLHKEGFYEARMVPLRDKHGSIVGGINYIRDISEIVISEKKIERTARLLAETQQMAKIGVWDFTFATQKIYWSDEMFRIFGLDKDEGITLEKYWKCLPENDRTYIQALHARANGTESTLNFNHTVLRPDGTLAYVCGSISFIKDEAGNLLRMAGFTQDITDKVLVEKELQASKRLQQQITEASPSLIYIFNLKEGKISYQNRSITKMLGYSSHFAEKMGEGFPQEIIHNDDLPAVQEFIAGFQVPKVADDDLRALEYRVRDAKGNWRWMSTRNLVFKRDENGMPTDIIGSMMDITESKLNEQNLLHTNAELERSNNELEQFAYVASHDLKEPLRMITSYAQLLLRNTTQEDENAKLYMNFIKDGVNNINLLIDDLLQYSRVSRKNNHFTQVDCNKIVDDIKKALSIKIDETDTSILADSLPVIIAVPVLIKQLFQNLIENAIKFRGKTTLPLIQISCMEQSHHWLFKVQDNGIGIAQEYYDRIFMIFQRLHTRSQYAGSGIGLSVCKKIVEIHKGNIWVESEKGKGSTFYFTIAKAF